MVGVGLEDRDLAETLRRGEIRQASHPDRRVAEAERLGCDRILVPERTPGDDASSRLVRVDGIVAALRAADLID